MSKSNPLALLILKLPVLWGGLATLGFYTLVQQGLLDHPMVIRYCASHPIEYITLTLFFIGIAALVAKAIDVAGQMSSLEKITLGPIPRGGQTAAEAAGLSEQLESGSFFKSGYLTRRLREALEYIDRKGTADSLDEHLRFASDVDAGRMHASYSFVRIIIWAIPILGFLGTVVGITLAIAKLGPEELESSLPLVISGLEVAFDTTALALALSIVLMFVQFVIDRFETHLLSNVDDRVSLQLVGRFQQYGAASDPSVASIHRMAEAVIDATEQMVQRQSRIWQESIVETHDSWDRVTKATGETIQQGLERGLAASLEQHAAAMAKAEKDASESARDRWREALDAFRQNTSAVESQQSELTRQGDILLQVVEATGQVKQLESSLNKNLSALAGAGNFEETVTSLAAAIQLLSSRLHLAPVDGSRVELNLNTAKNDAA